MTLVIAVEERGRIIMGADSAAGEPGEFYAFNHLEKIARCGPYLVGFCGSLRVGQVLHHLVEWPEPPAEVPLTSFLVREVAPAISQAMHDAGAVREGQGILGEKTVVLLAVRGELYAIGSDLTLIRIDGPACIGCGRHAAYPAMEALALAGVETARRRIEITLEIVARRVPVVEPPFHFLESAFVSDTHE